MGALATVCKMQPSSPTLGIIARELALDLADAIYDPQLVSHVPGVANLAADALSRFHQPGKRFVLPPILKDALEITVPPRPLSWWRSLVPRQSHLGEAGAPPQLKDNVFQ